MNKLLFLCTGNYYRSRFAEYYIRHRAEELGLHWNVDSRGLGLSSNNVGPLSPFTVSACDQLGISYLPSRAPQTLTRADLEQADLTVALKEAEHRPLMQLLFPDWEHRIRYWHIDDIDRAPAAEVLPQLRQLLDEFIATLD